MKRFFVVISVVALGLIFSCKKKKEEFIFTYAETQCADPWNQIEGAFDMSREDRISAYLESEEIDFSDLSIENIGEGMIFCAACNCASGFKISLAATDNFSDQLENLGFIIE